MGNAESNESAAVKRQAEGFSNPMYRLLDLGVSSRASNEDLRRFHNQAAEGPFYANQTKVS